MKGRLSRTRARASIVLFAVGLALLLAGYFAEGWVPTILAVVFVIAGMAARPWKCPCCGRQISPMPQWSQPGKYHCPYCGNRFAYDDEE